MSFQLIRVFDEIIPLVMFLCPSCFLEELVMTHWMLLNAVIKAGWGEVQTCYADTLIISH